MLVWKSRSKADANLGTRHSATTDSCTTSREGPYATTLDIAVEILSDDEGRYILEKCRNYEKAGVRQIFVLDPETHAIYEWNNGLLQLTDLQLANGKRISGATIWDEFESRMEPHIETL